MCIIVYKPQDVALPSKETLQTCFFRNPDGAGYMFPENKGIHIKKGFMTFDDFYKSLVKDYADNGFKKSFVLHFRIGTQGGNTPQNTHPFPLSQDVSELRELDKITDVGIAHNGIIHLTSNYMQTKTSDTMDFITQFLSLIINESDWYNKKYYPKAKLLIERLIGGYNKLAIMSKDGHVELIGDFEKDNGCYYSNTSYLSYKSYKDTLLYEDDYDDYDYDEDLDELQEKQRKEYFEKFRDPETEWYDFNESNCPFALYNDDRYCWECSNFAKCMLGYDDINKETCKNKGCSKCPHKGECPNFHWYV